MLHLVCLSLVSGEHAEPKNVRIVQGNKLKFTGVLVLPLPVH